MRAIAAVLILLIAAPGAQAALSDAGPTAFMVTQEADIAAKPERVWRALVHPSKWWSQAHTFFGDSRDLRLTAKPGGCFCEIRGRDFVEHARVVYAAEPKTLRLDGAIGPLQALAVNGLMSFTLAEKDGRTHLTWTYRVAGDESAGLGELAAPVDRVIGEQFDRLKRYVETGSAE
ncbi:MAG: ATPase [Alphaproteobacteria bacterium]|nr:ATPase [Alphaproteobacteria bacterium]